ncbi:c-type cytochrome [Paraglaciecola aquimarina]|uniref:C-type cytochrome n=1 Tax=Paraglaciecola algarum TaxID=3050085 RepID=A0ABS9DAW9_9ALTE|nr:c-type cytochrome [Paraglaciecola sp. G1-23]
MQISRLEEQGSSFKAVDESKVLSSQDHWFRPVDIKAGPDGAVYIADWYDSRLSHVDPRDTWNKNTGRIYRLRSKQSQPQGQFDFSQYSISELTTALKSENKWFRQQALRQFGDRNDAQAIHALLPLFRGNNAQNALEALWAIHLSGGLSDDLVIEALEHKDPYVRLWAVRLVGDNKQASKIVADKLVQLARQERHLEVIGQLASSAKRLSGELAIPIIAQLIVNPASQHDIENQMLIWWAMESKAVAYRTALLKIFSKQNIWQLPIVKNVLITRLMQRYALAGGMLNYQTSAELLALSPSDQDSKIMLAALQQSIQSVELNLLPEQLVSQMQLLQNKFGEGKLSNGIKQKDPTVIQEALSIIAKGKGQALERLSYIKLMGQIQETQAIPILLKLVIDGTETTGARFEALQALGKFNSAELGSKLVSYYPDKLRADPLLKDAALSLFATRAEWAKALLIMVNQTRQVKKADIPDHIVRKVKLLNDQALTHQVDQIWPEVRVTNTDEKSQEISKIKQALDVGKGIASDGKIVFNQYCGACHQLFGQGGHLGPDLTGYDRNNVNSFVLNIVDPNAEIREGYVLYQAKHKNGQSLVGFVQDRNASQLILKPVGQDAVTFMLDDLVSLEVQSRSIMPERIIEHLSHQQIRDLFAYIRQ